MRSARCELAKCLHSGSCPLSSEHRFTCFVPFFTLSSRTKGVLEDTSAILTGASVVALPNVCRDGPDCLVQLGGDFCGKWMCSKHFGVRKRRLEELLRQQINPHALEWVTHEVSIRQLESGKAPQLRLNNRIAEQPRCALRAGLPNAESVRIAHCAVGPLHGSVRASPRLSKVAR